MKGNNSKLIACFITRQGFSLLLAAVLVALSAFVLSCAPGERIAISPTEDTLVIVGGTLIDGTGREPLKDAVVVIEGNRIKLVSQRDKVSYPKNIWLIDTTGKTILPGLIDVEVHLSLSGGPHGSTFGRVRPNLRAHLYNGVTSVRDMCAMKHSALEWREAVNSGRWLGPRLFVAGPGIVAPGAHLPSPRPPVEQPRSPEEGREIVRTLAEDGVDVISVAYTVGCKSEELSVSANVLKAIIEEAHEHGLQVVAHTCASEGIKEAVLLGIDGVAHGAYRDPLSHEVIALLVEKRVYYVPTLSFFEGYLPLVNDPNFLDSPLLKGSVSKPLIRMLKALIKTGRLKLSDERIEYMRSALEVSKENLRRLSEAGGKIALGTNAGDVLAFHGLSVHRELELMVEAGLSPMEAIVAGTKTAAECLGKGEELGTIEEGKLADIIIIAGNPLANISETRNVEVVIKDGVVLDRESLYME